MKKNLTKIISSITIPLTIAGGLYFSTPKYSCAEDDGYLKKGGKMIEMLDKLSKTKPGQVIDNGRKKVEDWAVKQGTGKTLTELEKEGHDAIKSFGTNNSPKQENNYTPSNKTYNQEPKITPKTEEELIKEQAIQRTKEIIEQTRILSGPLNKDKITLLFKNRINDSENSYNLDKIEWKTGSFTDKGAEEALVNFYDDNQGHANGASEIWLLKLRNSMWEIDRKITENDYTSFETVDIQKDGRLEILIKEGGGNQGYFVNTDRLISIDGETIKVLYSNEGHSNGSGRCDAGEDISVDHKVKFVDLDNDGILEIIDLKETRTYTGTKPASFGDDIEGKTLSKSIEITYKLQGNKYVKIKSLEKLSYEEKIIKQLTLTYDKCKEYVIGTSKSCKKAYDTIIDFLKDFFTGKDFIEYSAKKGDTLSIVSKNKTGDWKNWKSILEYNKKHNYKSFDENINIGEKIYIPKHMLKK